MKKVRSTSPVLTPFQVLTVLVALAGWGGMAQADFITTNLVTDDQTANSAQITDAHLVNAWGISFDSTSFWVSSNRKGLANLYSVDSVTNATAKLAREVIIPGDGSVTGQVFNGTSGFNGDQVLFVSEDGTISGWQAA